MLLKVCLVTERSEKKERPEASGALQRRCGNRCDPSKCCNSVEPWRPWLTIRQPRGEKGGFESNGIRGTPIWQMWFLRFGSGKTSFHVFDGPRKARGGQSLFLGMWVTESRIQQISIGLHRKKNWTCVICGCGEISMSKFFWFPQAAWWNIEGKKDWEWENGTCQSWNMREFSNKTWDTSTIPRQCPKRSGWRYRFRAFCPSAKLEVIWVAISQSCNLSKVLHFIFFCFAPRTFFGWFPLFLCRFPPMCCVEHDRIRPRVFRWGTWTYPYRPQAVDPIGTERAGRGDYNSPQFICGMGTQIFR